MYQDMVDVFFVSKRDREHNFHASCLGEEDGEVRAFYNDLESGSTKQLATKEIQHCIEFTRKQIEKNFGYWEWHTERQELVAKKVKRKEKSGTDEMVDAVGDRYAEQVMKFFYIAQLFDHRLKGKVATPNPENEDAFFAFAADSLPFFHTFNYDQKRAIVNQLRQYVRTNFSNFTSPVEFWQAHLQESGREQRSMRELAAVALRVLAIPPDGVDVERAVSAYGNIVTEKRTRLKDKSIRALMLIYFNNENRLKANEDRAAKQEARFRNNWPLDKAFPRFPSNAGRSAENELDKIRQLVLEEGLFKLKKDPPATGEDLE